jgi:hypothetical protein
MMASTEAPPQKTFSFFRSQTVPVVAQREVFFASKESPVQKASETTKEYPCQQQDAQGLPETYGGNAYRACQRRVPEQHDRKGEDGDAKQDQDDDFCAMTMHDISCLFCDSKMVLGVLATPSHHADGPGRKIFFVWQFFSLQADISAC